MRPLRVPPARAGVRGGWGRRRGEPFFAHDQGPSGLLRVSAEAKRSRWIRSNGRRGPVAVREDHGLASEGERAQVRGMRWACAATFTSLLPCQIHAAFLNDLKRSKRKTDERVSLVSRGYCRFSKSTNSSPVARVKERFRSSVDENEIVNCGCTKRKHVHASSGLLVLLYGTARCSL